MLERVKTFLGSRRKRLQLLFLLFCLMDGVLPLIPSTEAQVYHLAAMMWIMMFLILEEIESKQR